MPEMKFLRFDGFDVFITCAKYRFWKLYASNLYAEARLQHSLRQRSKHLRPGLVAPLIAHGTATSRSKSNGLQRPRTIIAVLNHIHAVA
jgi:hypothetical protein